MCKRKDMLINRKSVRKLNREGENPNSLSMNMNPLLDLRKPEQQN